MLNKLNQLDDSYIEILPEIIKHEYCRVTDLINSGENYGALMQLKDAAETILKLYASIGLAEINKNENKTEEEIRILFEVTDKILSLGDWAAVITKLIQFNINDNLKNVCMGINELNDPNGNISIVEWRNRCLGHGALGYLGNTNYENEFVKIYNGLTEFLEIYISNIEYISVKTMGDEIYVEYDSDKILSLYPFVTIDDKKVFFFDSYIEQKKKLEVLNYYYGMRKTYKKGTVYESIRKIHSDYARGTQTRFLNANESYEKDVFSYEMEEIVKRNSYVNDSEKAIFIEDWLNEKLKEQEKGIYWLQMPGGSGKTTIVQQLDKVTSTKINLNNTTVKAIYINNTYNSNTELILQELDILFTHNKNGKLLFKGTNKPQFDRTNPKKKEEMANYLNAMFKMVKEQRIIVSQKLLIVFDGLDELTDAEFYDYLPHLNDLDSNIYILLTSRPEREFLPFRHSLNRDNEIDIYVPQIDETLKILMENYLCRSKSDLTEEKKKLYLNLSGNNFSYLHFLVTYSSLMDLELDFESDMVSILSGYLKHIQRIYGTKFSKKMFLTLYILANISSAISLKQLSQILGEEYVSFELLGVIQDVIGLLRIDRYRGNIYQISNADLKGSLKQALAQTAILDYEKELTDLIFEQVDTIFDNINEGNFELSQNDYSLIYTIFVCEFDAFIRLTNYYFTGFSLIIMAYVLKSSFSDECESANANIHLLYEKLCEFSSIQVAMIEEGIKPKEDDEIKYYQIMTAIFASEKMWISWFFRKQRENDVDDIKKETSLINILYESLLEFKEFLDLNNETDYLLHLLLRQRIGDLLQHMQMIYGELGLTMLEIKYTNLILEEMRKSETDKFYPDYSLEFRRLQHIYEREGKTELAKKYELMAVNDEKEKSNLSLRNSDFIHFRKISEEFTSLMITLNSHSTDTNINRAFEIEDEIYELILTKCNQAIKPENYEYLECIKMENELAALAHEHGNVMENLYWYERLESIVKTMDKDTRFLFDTEITINMITYAANLIEWEMIEEAETVVANYSLGFEMLDDDMYKQSMSPAEYSYVTSALSIVLYVLDKIKHPEYLHEIARAKQVMDCSDLLHCDSIIESYSQKNGGNKVNAPQ